MNFLVFLDQDFIHQFVDGVSYGLVVLVHVPWTSSDADALKLGFQ